MRVGRWREARDEGFGRSVESPYQAVQQLALQDQSTPNRLQQPLADDDQLEDRFDLIGQRLQDVLGIFADSSEQRLGGSGGFTMSLLPITERADLHVDDGGELGLRQPGRFGEFP